MKRMVTSVIACFFFYLFFFYILCIFLYSFIEVGKRGRNAALLCWSGLMVSKII